MNEDEEDLDWSDLEEEPFDSEDDLYPSSATLASSNSEQSSFVVGKTKGNELLSTAKNSDKDEISTSSERGSVDAENKDIQFKTNGIATDTDTVRGFYKRSSVTDIPMNLSMNIGCVELSKGSVDSLDPGDLLDIHTKYENRVSINANGVEIGIGRIVKINDRIAVQISYLWGKT